MSTILAIETSCDETGVAIVKNRQILSNIVASQIDLHRTYGGVVPEVASRQHLEVMNACLEEALDKAQLGWSEIDGVAVTVAPGLVGALLVGLATAKTLAMVHNKPLIGIHHLEGHIYASYLSEPTLEPPFLCLLVSGGHTSLIAVRGCGDYTMLGATRDDAAGEAFDKTARLLGLGYPGGPAIDRAARSGDPFAYSLPEGKVSRPEGGYYPYEFSFSGLKTAVSRLVKALDAKAAELRARDAQLPDGELGSYFAHRNVDRRTFVEECRCRQSVLTRDRLTDPDSRLRETLRWLVASEVHPAAYQRALWEVTGLMKRRPGMVEGLGKEGMQGKLAGIRETAGAYGAKVGLWWNGR